MPARGPALRPRTLALAAVLLLVVNGAVLAAAWHFSRSSGNADRTLKRADPLADLLGWLPQSDGDAGLFAAQLGAADPSQPSLTPAPRTLGRTSAWRTRFGYGIVDIAGWATAGTDAQVAVLSGAFDFGGIETSLTRVGYQKSIYHRAVIFTLSGSGPGVPNLDDGASADAAVVIAVLDQRLITGVEVKGVRAAIDAAQGRTSSLADLAPIAAAIASLTPTGLAALDQVNQSRLCAAIMPNPRLPDRYAMIASSQLAGQPRVTLALAYESEHAAGGAVSLLSGRGGLANPRQLHGLALADVTAGGAMDLLVRTPACETVRQTLAAAFSKTLPAGKATPQ